VKPKQCIIIEPPDFYRCYTNCKSVRISRNRAPWQRYHISTSSARWTADVTSLNLRHHQRTDSRHACAPSSPPPLDGPPERKWLISGTTIDGTAHRTDCQRGCTRSPPKMLARMPAKLGFYSLTLQVDNDQLVLLLHSVHCFSQLYHQAKDHLDWLKE
jgi:hypothetical protein